MANGLTYRLGMTESEVTRLLDGALKRAGALVVPIVGGLMQKSGLPDRRYESKLWSGWVEWKRGDNQLSPLQKRFGEQCELRGSPFLIGRTFGTRLSFETAGGLIVDEDESFFGDVKLNAGKAGDEADTGLLEAGRHLLVTMAVAWRRSMEARV